MTNTSSVPYMTKSFTTAHDHNQEIDELTSNNLQSIDGAWILITTFIIFTMQSGFGLLESGMVSRKNESNVMVRNMLDMTLGGFSFWMIGFGLGYSDSGNSIIGTDDFFLNTDIVDNASKYALYFSQLALATTSTTIISGAIAERVNLKAYMLFSLIHTGLIYPLPSRWMWNSMGWLKQLGAHDFAGCCAVHISGGMAALVSCYLIGPRRKRFGRKKDRYYMASPTNVILGTFLLWFGWIGFNCGSTKQMSKGLWKVASRTAVVTMNGANGGGLGAILLSAVLKVKRGFLLDIPQLSAGILGGLVGVTGIASSCELWEAFIIGAVGGLIANGAISLLKKLHVDDPVGAVGIHWAAGSWGMIAVGFFGKTDPIAGIQPKNGIFHGGSGSLLSCNLLAVVAVSAWSGTLTAICVLLMKRTIKFRISEVNEIRGSDDVDHNIKDPIVIFHATNAFGKRIVIPNGNTEEVPKPVTGLNNVLETEPTSYRQIFDITQEECQSSEKSFNMSFKNASSV